MVGWEFHTSCSNDNNNIKKKRKKNTSDEMSEQINFVQVWKSFLDLKNNELVKHIN